MFHGKRPGLFVAMFTLLVWSVPAHAIKIQRVVSPGGIEAWLVQDSTVPVLALRAAFDGGAALDPANREGLAEMVSGLLDEGAGDLDSEAFQKRLADLSVGLSFDAGRDVVVARLTTLSENSGEAFRLLALAMTKPRFDAEPVQRIRGQILSNLARRSQDPNYLSYRAWYQAVFAGHPYSRPVEGLPESIERIDDSDLRGFVRRRLARDNVSIGVAGDISPAALATLLDSTFGSLPEKATPVQLGEAEPAAAGDVIVLRQPIPQSIAIFGQKGLKRDDSDWYAASVMNYVLGGGSFNSRLTEEVRERRGLAYSVYSSLSPYDYGGVIIGRVATRNGRIAESLDVIRSEWSRMAAKGISSDELEGAKTYLTGSFPLTLDSTSSIAATLIALQRYKLGIDYLDRRNDLIRSVTEADVRRVARRLLDADKLTTVIVGQPDGIKPTREVPGSG